MFQLIGLKKEKNFTVLILPDNYKVEIGSESTELKLADDSINKDHGSICYDTSLDEIIIIDNQSKHGTFVLI